MTGIIRVSALSVLSLLVFAVPAIAHHAFTAEFDGSQSVTLTGTLSKVEWINPHVYLYVDVKASDGNVTQWAVECNSTVTLHRQGMTRSMLTEGQNVTVQVNPAKDGTKSRASLRHITLQNGTEVNFQNNNDAAPADQK